MSSDEFERWQSITLTQFTYSINIFLSFSAASLGFALSMLFNNSFAPSGFAKICYTSSLFLLFASLLFGIICILSRLIDFRTTAKVARMKNMSENGNKIESERDIAKKLGGFTWLFFYSQISLFSIGMLAFLICIMITFENKLFCC